MAPADEEASESKLVELEMAELSSENIASSSSSALRISRVLHGGGVWKGGWRRH